MTDRRRLAHSPIAPIVLMLGMATALAACGGDAGSSSDQASATPTPSPTATPSPTVAPGPCTAHLTFSGAFSGSLNGSGRIEAGAEGAQASASGSVGTRSVQVTVIASTVGQTVLVRAKPGGAFAAGRVTGATLSRDGRGVTLTQVRLPGAGGGAAVVIDGTLSC